MPEVVHFALVRDGGPGAHQGHFSLQHVEELGKLVQARLPQDIPQGGNPSVTGHPVNALPPLPPLRRGSSVPPGDEFRHVLFGGRIVVVDVHGAELQGGESFSPLPQPVLFEEHRPLGGELDPQDDGQEDRRENHQPGKASGDVQPPLDERGDFFLPGSSW